MTNLRRTCLAPIALLTLLIAIPGHVAAASLVPFQATVAESQTVAFCSPMPSLCITIVGTGQATHLGEIQEQAVVVSNLASTVGPGCKSETRKTVLTAANGDSITMEATGVSCTTSPTTATAVDSYQVVGGTGRFSGASGSGIDTAHIVIGKTAVATFTGLLATPGSLQ